jgi:hypothetical protein
MHPLDISIHALNQWFPLHIKNMRSLGFWDGDNSAALLQRHCSPDSKVIPNFPWTQLSLAPPHASCLSRIQKKHWHQCGTRGGILPLNAWCWNPSKISIKISTFLPQLVPSTSKQGCQMHPYTAQNVKNFQVNSMPKAFQGPLLIPGRSQHH